MLTIATSLPNGQADEIPANDAKTVVLNTGGEPVVLSFKTGNNPAGFHWEVTDEGYNTVATGGNYTQANTMVNANLCLPTVAGTCFYLRLYDDYGDGLCCTNGNGYWEVRTPTGGLLLRDLFDSSVDGTTSPSWGAISPGYDFRGHQFCLPTGPAYIETTRCGVFNYALGNKIFCNKVTGATQYEFEFLDPDAGFMRRVTKTINYVQFWDMVVNPLTPGVKYFVRVRSDKNGPLASAHWGTGCEVGLGIAETVLCSGLIPAPLYGHSCDETRAFNTNNSFIYATPVTGATEYQFRITNTGEGYSQTFTRSTYILQLKWNSSVAPPLV
ncbi:MAG: hypothetical protein JSS84_10570, partial [Bacteroidetes bacterium]|nr:hypothetical protein [Bacteroidota bacterium]